MNASEPLPPAQPALLESRCRQIQWLLVDVDGVLTDGSIVYADSGVEIKAFHVRDGSGLKIWQGEGKRAGIITGRSSPVVAKRSAELGLHPVIQGAADKFMAYTRVLAEEQLEPQQVCYIGDDLPDVPILADCGLAIAVADACPEARARAHYVTQKPGGRGAVREAIELILRCRGRWQRIVETYLTPTTKRGPGRVDT